jgi:hypothetical protein
MSKRERVKCRSTSAAARLLRRDIPPMPTASRQLRRAKVVSRDLRAALARVLRPTEAEIQADKYEGNVPVRQWLDLGSRKYD